MAKRPCCSSSPRARVSQPEPANRRLIESLISLSDDSVLSLGVSFEDLVESRASDLDQIDLIQRFTRLGSVFLAAANRRERKRFERHNSLVWPLPYDITIKVITDDEADVTTNLEQAKEAEVTPVTVPDEEVSVVVLSVEDHALKVKEAQKRRKAELAAERKAKKAKVDDPSTVAKVPSTEVDTASKASGVEESTKQAEVPPASKEPEVQPQETGASRNAAEGRGDHQPGSPPLSSSGPGLASISRSIPVSHQRLLLNVDEVKQKFGVEGVFDNNPGAGLLALASLQQFPSDVGRLETDYHKLVAQGQALIPQGYLALNAALAHQVALTKHYATRCNEEKASAEKLRSEVSQAKALADQVVDLEVRRVEAFRQKEAAEKLAGQFQLKCGHLMGVEDKAKELADEVEALKGQLAGVDAKVEAAVTKARLEEREECQKKAEAFYNEFYVSGWADSAQFSRRPADDKVWDINNVPLPQKDAKVPLLEPLTPREASDDEV